MVRIFRWDPSKAAENIKKHGISFPEAVSAFADPMALLLDDPDHSQAEDREILVGHSRSLQLLVVASTERNGSTRIISARRATRRERQTYEEATTN